MPSRFKMFKDSHEKICYYCGRILTKKIESIDHLTPVSKGGTNQESNLVMCCVDCNREKSDMNEPEYKAFLQEKNSKINDPVNLSEIKISHRFQNSGVSQKKVDKVIVFFNQFGKLDKKIILKNYKSKLLVDGFSRYQAAKLLGLTEVSVKYANT